MTTAPLRPVRRHRLQRLRRGPLPLLPRHHHPHHRREALPRLPPRAPARPRRHPQGHPPPRPEEHPPRPHRPPPPPRPPHRHARHRRRRRRRTSCPACEASSRSDNREAVPLYAGDKALLDERCSYCGHRLVDLTLQRAAETVTSYRVDHLADAQGRPALHFDRRPPEHILQALKMAGWRWAPRDRMWIDPSRSAELPASIPVAPKAPVVVARPPIIRRRRGPLDTAADARR